MMGPKMPLEGVKVLDWTIWQVGGLSTAMLGSLGADVIKIESKQSGVPERAVSMVRGLPARLPNGHAMHHEMYNYNKRSIALDLTTPAGKEVLYRLAKKSDVFVQNFRPGTASKLRVDYETLRQLNPRLIYADASGFGPEGPDADQTAMDISGIARSGLMMMSAGPDLSPQYVGSGMADSMGAIFTAYGVLTALYVRERTGVGQHLHSSMLGGLVALQSVAVGMTNVSDIEFPRHEREEAGNPMWNWYKCKDGKWIVFSHFQPEPGWSAFCQTLGLPEVERDPRFCRSELRDINKKELIPILDKAFLRKSRSEWLEALKGKDLIYSSVNSINDLVRDPQILANEYIVQYENPLEGKMNMLGCPVRFSETPAVAVRCRAPEWGEHTEQILLEEAGYSWEEIEGLRNSGAIP